MRWIRLQGSERRRLLRLALSIALIVSTCACAAVPAPDAAGPRSTEPAYPTLTESDESREAALSAWANLTRAQGITGAPAPELQPVTATLKSLPPALNPPLYLPKVGAEPTMKEEEMREALRRFIVGQPTLIGALPQQLSLVQRTDLADGTQRALYRQRPFRYPLRNGYGRLEILFTTDRRILQMTSTCIPEVEELQRTLATMTPNLNTEQVEANLIGQSFTYTDASSNQQTFTVVQGDEINVNELVIYPIERGGAQVLLEFHLAWEIVVGRGAAARTVYLDALTNKALAATVTPQT